MWRGMEFHILGAATRKARAPNERLCCGTDWQMDAWTLWTCDIEKLGKMWRMTINYFRFCVAIQLTSVFLCAFIHELISWTIWHLFCCQLLSNILILSLYLVQSLCTPASKHSDNDAAHRLNAWPPSDERKRTIDKVESTTIKFYFVVNEL